MNEDNDVVEFHWEGKHINFGEKTADWYWAVGIVAGAGVIVAILFNNLLLALMIALGTAALIMVNIKEPRIHRFSITADGLFVDDQHFPYEKIHSFSVLEYIDPTLPPALSIKTHYLLAHHLLIPILDHDPEHLYTFLSNHLPDGGHQHHVFDRLLERMRL